MPAGNKICEARENKSMEKVITRKWVCIFSSLQTFQSGLNGSKLLNQISRIMFGVQIAQTISNHIQAEHSEMPSANQKYFSFSTPQKS